MTQTHFSWLQNPPIEIDVYFDRLVVKLPNGQHLEHCANPKFSNSRMVVANFERAVINAQELIKKIPTKWYLGKPVAIINVKENFADGFILIERKILLEMFALAKTRPFIFYQGELVEVHQS